MIRVDTVAQRSAVVRLRSAGIEGAAGEVRRLVRWAEAQDGAMQRFEDGVARRACREPFAYITGHKAFWRDSFLVSPEVLVPRPDSETLVRAAAAELARSGLAEGGARILDLGTGSGCLLLSLLRECPSATGLGIDNDSAALAVAGANARKLGLAARARFRFGNWGDRVRERFDAVVCNPPYIPTRDIDGLADEVRLAEPRTAIDGGADGLDAWRAVVPGLRELLKPGGFGCLEIGIFQAPAVTAIAKAHSLRVAALHRDLDGRERGVVVRPAPDGDRREVAPSGRTPGVGTRGA